MSNRIESDSHVLSPDLLMESPIYGEITRESAPTYANGRWWDLEHSLLAAGHMNMILRGERQWGSLVNLTEEEYRRERAILIPSIILHDIGWGLVEGDDKQTRWSDPAMRVEHMRLGAEKAREILTKVNYPEDLTEEIVALIAVHDNQYLGIEPQTVREQIHRDADACFIFTQTSFWKDFNAKKAKDPLEFLEKQAAKYRVRFTAEGQRITDLEIAARRMEIEMDIKSPQEWFELIKNRADIKRSVVAEAPQSI